MKRGQRIKLVLHVKSVTQASAFWVDLVLEPGPFHVQFPIEEYPGVGSEVAVWLAHTEDDLR